MIIIWAVAALLAVLFTLFIVIKGKGRLEHLEDEPCLSSSEAERLPLVSVIIPACNEAANITGTVIDLVHQGYPHLEIIVINDRSTDTTGAVIDELTASYEQVRSKHIDYLPDGWLGKNHALQCGAEMSAGEYLLFTDADVCLEKTTILRAMHRMSVEKLDHLTLLFRNTTPGGLLNAVIIEAMTGLLAVFQPWEIKKNNSKFFLGIGAFNLVSRKAYLAIGGHAVNAMHPIDDIMLGKAIHKGGFKQDCLRGESFVTVAWYRNTGDMVEGLMKNVFSFYNFNILLSISAALFMLLFSILPYFGVVFYSGGTQLLCLVTVVCKGAVFVMSGRAMKQPVRYVIWQPAAVCILLYISLRATVKTISEGGITWRGTFYPLKELRQIEPILTIKWLLSPSFISK